MPGSTRSLLVYAAAFMLLLPGAPVKPLHAGVQTVTDSAGIVHFPFLTFDSLPVTGPASVPESGGGFIYDPASFDGRAGWRAASRYPDNLTYDSFKLYSPGYNTEHMGFESYGYLEVDSQRSVSGNSLKYVVTGGKNSRSCPSGPGPECLPLGQPVYHKRQFLENRAALPAPGSVPAPVGNPYLYIMNNGSSTAPVPFREAAGANRLSLYMWVPESLDIGSGGRNTAPSPTFSFGPYSNVPKYRVFPGSRDRSGIAGHWYHTYQINGGGWIRFYIESHPQHSNTFSKEADFPFPGRGLRNIGEPYFTHMYRLYLTTSRYNGFAVPPFSIWIDELEFLNDNEPQNEETINSVSVMFNPLRNLFEVGFSDKYSSSTGSAAATYELRYSFRPITNASWNQARPAHILKHDGFRIEDNRDGRISKSNAYYNRVWSAFRLSEPDQVSLKPGIKVYFAVKDISQKGGNGRDPATPGAGRDYRRFPGCFDYDGDRDSLPLIKRFDYTVIEAAIMKRGEP